jgi:hypothetical protein
MARRAVNQHKTKPAKRTSRRKLSRQSRRGSLPPNCQAIDDVYFRRWRDLFGSERALQHLEDTLRSRPSWLFSARGEVTRVDPGFWLSTTLSEEINAEGIDCLAVHYTAPVHGPNYSRYNGRFFLRTVDIIEYEERWSGNNVTSDYSPVEKFEQEEGLRPRTPPRRYPAAVAPPPGPETAPDQPPEDKTGDPVEAEADDSLSAVESSHKNVASPLKPKKWLPIEHKRRQQLTDIPIPKDITTYGLQLHDTAVEAVGLKRLTSAPSARRFETLLHDLELFPKVKRRTKDARKTHD